MARAPFLIISGIVVLAFSNLIFPRVSETFNRLAGREVEVLDLRFGFSVGQAYQLFEELGPEGRSTYRLVELTLDVVYPLVYGAFLVGLLWFLSGRFLPQDSPGRRLALLPFLAGLFDLSENVSLAVLISHYPEQMAGLTRFASISNQLKFSFLALSVALALAALIAWGVRAFLPRS